MSVLRLLSVWLWGHKRVLLGFSSGDLGMSVCCSFLEAVQSFSGGGGETDLKFEQNRGNGIWEGVPPFRGGGEITCSHRGVLLERICSEHLFTCVWGYALLGSFDCTG